MSELLERIQDWVQQNKLVATVVGVAFILLVLIVGYNIAFPKQERDLQRDIKITQEIAQQREDIQAEVQENIGINIELPSKEELRNRIDQVYEAQHGTTSGIDYQSNEVAQIVLQEFGEDIYKLYIADLLPDLQLTQFEQEALAVEMLNTLYMDDSPYELVNNRLEIVSTLNDTIVRDKTVGPYEYSEDDVVVDIPYPVSDINNGNSMFMQNVYTSLDLGTVSLLNPIVTRMVYESDGVEDVVYQLTAVPVANEEMATTDYLRALVDAKINFVGVGDFTITGLDDPALNDEVYNHMVASDDTVTQTKIHPSQYYQTVEYYLTGVEETPNQYAELTVGSSTVNLPVAYSGTRAHLRPQ